MDKRIKVKIDFDNTFDKDVALQIVELCRVKDYTSRKSNPGDIIVLTDIIKVNGVDQIFGCMGRIIDNSFMKTHIEMKNFRSINAQVAMQEVRASIEASIPKA